MTADGQRPSDFRFTAFDFNTTKYDAMMSFKQDFLVCPPPKQVINDDNNRVAILGRMVT